MAGDSIKRFSDRVNNYIKYRPSYPKELIAFLQKEKILHKNTTVADIGSGTGIFTTLLLETGCKVYAIEPNKEMREAGEVLLKHYPNFISINGQAEATTLQTKSITLITAAQAFHWFDYEKTQIEFKRILTTGGYIVLIWNERQTSTSFEKEYEILLNMFCPDYKLSKHRDFDELKIQHFFNGKKVREYICGNYQIFNFDGLKGRLESSSYVPSKSHPGYIPLMNALERLFKKHQKNNQIRLNYKTHMFYGQFQ